MTEATIEREREIFDHPLEGDELQAINALVNQHKGNAAVTQQLALDASRLVSTSQERLTKQADSGFFKRFTSKISGKNSENQLQNQVDMLQMQKFAWHYLKQLQQQNLINAQSIAVIRNNLGTMNDYIIETRDFLEQAVDKISQRLDHVENHTRLNNWSLHIEANKHRFKSIPDTLLVVHLTYDFMRSHPNVMLTSRDINYLVVTLQNLEVNCDEDVQLLDFIIKLIEQIEIYGIARYREMIELAFDSHIIDSHFIQKNISGIGFNALYFLSEQYEKLVDLTEDSTFCKTEEDREKIISKFFGNEFSSLSTTYSIRDLIGEVIGGSLLAVDIYKEVNGLNVVHEEFTEDQHSENISLISSLPDIAVHTLLDSIDSDKARYNYLRLFALCIDNSASLSKSGQDFLTLLTEKAGCPELYEEIINIADSPYKKDEYLSVMQTVLSGDEKIYTWLIDAFFLLSQCQKKIENPQMLRIISILKPAQFKKNFPHLLALVNESDETQLLDAATMLAPHTEGWKNIVRYRELRFDQSYAETEKELDSACTAIHFFRFDFVKTSSKASEYAHYMGSWEEDSLLFKFGSAVVGSAYALGRSSSLSSLNEMRNKAIKLIHEHSGTLNQANSMIARLNIPTIEFNNEISYSDYELDNSAANEDWHEQFLHFEHQVESTMSAFAEAFSDAGEQLGYFKAGKFNKSVIEVKLQQITAHELEKQQEQLEKQSVMIEKESQPHRLSIEWRNVEHPPCDPEEIRHIKTDGKIWVIVDNDGGFYRSEDREHWLTIRPSMTEDSLNVYKLDIVNGLWVLVVGYDEGFYYSSDAITWQQSSFPSQPSSYDFSRTEDIVHFNGQWLWRFTERTEYSYTEKGILFNSKKPQLMIELRSIVLIALMVSGNTGKAHRNSLKAWKSKVFVLCRESLACCHSANTITCTPKIKKKDTAPIVNYYLPKKGWRTCTWGSEDGYYRDIIVTRMSDRFMCLYSNQIMTSDKGYDWKCHPEKRYFNACFHLENVSFFTSWNDNQVIHLSQDAETFKELMLEEGSWQYFCANDQGILSVYSPNSHETFLRAGQVIC